MWDIKILNKNYLSSDNIKNILYACTIPGYIAIAETMLIISGNIDLSTGSIGAFGGVVCALLINAGVPWPVAVIIVIIVGGALGAFNALLVNVFNFESFIATLGYDVCL